MQKTKIPKILAVALILSVAMIGSGFAFAQTSTDPTVVAGLNAGATLKAGGFGALSGVILSILTVINKNQTDPSTGNEKVDPRKLGANLIIGAAVGVGLSFLGINVTTNPSIQAAFSTIIPLMVNYAALHWVNLTLRPMFGNWTIGRHAKDTTKPTTG